MSKRNSQYVPIREQPDSQPLGALASRTSFMWSDLALEDELFIARSDIMISWKRPVVGDGEGPLIFGLADKGINNVLLEEALEQNGPLHPADTVLEEQARRRIQFIGILSDRYGSSGDEIAREGWFFQHKTRMAFYEENAGWLWWVYNMGPDALSTGGAIDIVALHHARWSA